MTPGEDEVHGERPLTHGFLFADLRGYTAFIEGRGAAAAASLLDRYRSLVRAIVAKHNGAEIRTEGDSFYVVFPSASAAVHCALEIVEASTVPGGDADPIAVGIGVHAGEALPTAEGPVGTAVNIAARLCAIAAPGEVLVSDTVRALTRGVVDAAFVPAGRRRVKGVAEPLVIYRAVAPDAPVGGAARRVRTSGGPLVLVAAVVAAVAVLVAAVVLQRPTVPSSAANPTSDGGATATASPAATPRRVGEFASRNFAIPFTIQLGRGWEAVGDTTDLVAWYHPQRPTGWLDVVLVAAVLDPPCEGSTPAFIDEGPEHVIDWLATRSWLVHGSARPYNVGPYRGRAVDIEVPRGDQAPCGRDVGPTLFQLGGRSADFGAYFAANAGERKRVIAVDVDGRTVTLAIGKPGDDVESFWTLAEPLLQSIRFGEP